MPAARRTTRRSGDGEDVAAATTVALSASIKLQYAALILVAAAAAWLVYRDLLISRRFAVTAIGSTAFFVALLGTVQAFENHSELGVFEPVSERARAEWYGAWQAVFGVHPDNRDDPQLAEFYDRGNLSTRSFTASSVLNRLSDPSADHPRSRRGHVRGGRHDAACGACRRLARGDARRPPRRHRGILDVALDAPDGDSTTRISFNNQFPADSGATIVAHLDDGHRPGVVTIGPLVDFTQRVLPDHRGHRGILACAALVMVLAGSRFVVVVASVLRVVALIALASTGYIDNARYLLGPLTLMIVGGSWQHGPSHNTSPA